MISVSNSFELGDGVITDGWFGVTQSGFNGFYGANGFAQQSELAGATGLRWPGGTLSELRPEVYGLEVDGIFDATDLYAHNPNRARPDISEMISYVNANDIAFTMIVPTVRYIDDVELGVHQLTLFVSRLLNGEFGDVPNDFTLEMGNEYAALDGFSGRPELYGEIASRFTEVVSDLLSSGQSNPYGFNINVAIQMGVSHTDDEQIRGAFSAEALANIDAVIFHSLPISMRNFNRELDQGHSEDLGEHRVERIEDYAEAWYTAVLSAGGSDIDLSMTGWTVGGSANTPENVDLQYHDYGARAPSLILEMFSLYSSVGVDDATAWGFDVTNLNSFSKNVDGEIVQSHSGVMFEILADTLPGKAVTSEFAGHDRSDVSMVYSFASAEELVVYVAVNNIPGDSYLLDLDLSDFLSLELIASRSLTSELSSEFAGDPNAAEARLYERPVLETINVEFADAGIELVFSQDYQVIELTFSATGILGAEHGFNVIEGSDTADQITGGETDDLIYGFAGNDTLVGAAGSDEIHGGTGRDILSGWRGDDTLLGGSDGDWLYGNEGNDRLLGGDGADIIQGASGNDVLIGGAGEDTLDGGDGFDVASYEDAGQGVRLDLLKAHRSTGEAFGDLLIDIEEIHGSEHSDQLRGGHSDDRLFGGDGSDRLYGRSGTDILFGEDGADHLYGNLGKDILTGGADGSQDEFIFFKTKDSLAGSENRDVITDFNSGVDKIVLTRIDADATVAGNQAFTFVSDAEFSAAGQLRYQFEAESGFGLVQADVDGDGNADFEIELLYVQEITADDFML